MPTGRKRIPMSAQPELVVITYPEDELRASFDSITSNAGADVEPLAALLSSEAVGFRPLFGLSEDRLKFRAVALAEEIGVETPDLSVYYKAETTNESRESIAERLRADPLVSAAYIKPAAELPIMFADITSATEPTPPVTPSFTQLQAYLRPADDGGIDAGFAATKPGGGGSGVSIIDVEYAWRFEHEDLSENQGGVIGPSLFDDRLARNHGTAVLGVISGDSNPLGITGICPDANVRAVSAVGNPLESGGSAAAIRLAADLLDHGDIILIELHRPGPRFNFADREDKLGYIPVEWWPCDLKAIQYATSRGIIVVEAGGNGAEDLDDELYDINPQTSQGLMFPESWRNPFRRDPIDSGSIVVGAGVPALFEAGIAILGLDLGPPRSRLEFSNFGTLMDAQGWGRNVATCGFGDLQNGENENFWYSLSFDGTSSAAPIIAGALACVQGMLKAAGRPPLNPLEARALLRATGSPQQPNLAGVSSQRIGSLPDLREIFAALQL